MSIVSTELAQQIIADEMIDLHKKITLTKNDLTLLMKRGMVPLCEDFDISDTDDALAQLDTMQQVVYHAREKLSAILSYEKALRHYAKRSQELAKFNT